MRIADILSASVRSTLSQAKLRQLLETIHEVTPNSTGKSLMLISVI